ncbi:Uu.00g072550.m01.CDS01 [Anthostomella pinea]|uniref:Uu.00g072550.m01.CDS01 n=1 Tax=Anthostomella pinea TaxID=933095 RepID=A0AAI8YNX0_9PEZI|nr:Uu.00g072550.m01.CDS01 [Anthostomella pinea]
MKSVSLASVALLLASGINAAGKCKQGENYCGSELLKADHDQSQIDQSLFDAGEDNYYAADGGDDTLFYCFGGEDNEGLIKFLEVCDWKCDDAGQGNGDQCY